MQDRLAAFWLYFKTRDIEVVGVEISVVEVAVLKLSSINSRLMSRKLSVF